MKKAIVLGLLFCLYACPSFGQSALDSFYSVWMDETRDLEMRVDAYEEYIWEGYLYRDPDSAYLLAQDLIQFSKDNQVNDGLLLANNLIGVYYTERGNYDKALEAFEECLILNEEVKDTGGIITSFGNLAYTHTEMGSFQKALDYNQSSYDLAETIGDETSIALSYFQQGKSICIKINLKKL